MSIEAVNFGEFQLDLGKRVLLRGGSPVPLKSRALDILCVLAEAGGAVVSKDALMARVWPGRTVGENNIQVHISALRKALREGSTDTFVATIPGHGYRLVGLNAQQGAVPSEDAAEPVRLRGASLLGELRLSISVLPFAIIAEEADARATAHALTERLTTALSCVDPLRVIKPSMDASRAPGTREVRPDFVLDGNVYRTADQWHISVRLVDNATLQQIWGVTHNQPADPRAGLDDVVRNIVATTQINLLLHHGERVRQVGAASASDHVALGLVSFYEHTESAYKEAQSCAERALALESGYPAAQRLLSTVLWHQANFGFVQIDDALVRRVFSLAETALEANPTSEVYHWTMGLAFLMAKQHGRAAACMRRASELNPHFALAYGSLGTVLAWAGEPEESIRNSRIATLRTRPSWSASPVSRSSTESLSLDLAAAS